MSTTDFKTVEQTVLDKVENETEFSRSAIESMPNQIKLVDSDNGLDLFCYIKCESSDSDIIKKCRGVVFNGDKQIMNGFPYTYEYMVDNRDEINEQIKDIFDKCSFYDAYEGSLIRMFYFGDKWYISTNRKLDANKSRWSSTESFGYYFKQALENEELNNENFKAHLPNEGDIIERFQTILDTTKQYMFLLLNNDQNRIVCLSPNRPTVLHVGTFVNGVLNMDENVYIPYAKKHNFESLEDICNHVSEVDITKIQGIIVFAPDNTQYKIFNRDYYEYYRVRGNEPSIKFRYLQVRMNKRYNNLLRQLYPNFSDAFDEYENNIYAICKNIYKAYLDRFIRNIYVKVPPEEFKVIRSCHDWHLQNRETNKINLNKVIDIYNEQPATNINKMLRRLYIERKESEKQRIAGEIVPTVTDLPVMNQRNRQKYKPFLSKSKQE